MKSFIKVGFLTLMVMMGVAHADGVTYDESVTSTVAGSSPTDTYSANVAALVQRLEATASAVRAGKQTIVLNSQSPQVADMLNAAAQLRTIAGVADTTINALGKYSQKSFYENAPAQSKAAEDQGKHASWVLRMVVPGST